MGDRGNCKQFVPNIFNPSKCQNCFKTKEAHFALQQANSFDTSRLPGRQRGNSLFSIRDRNAAAKAPIKEGVLSKGTADSSDGKIKTWQSFWYILYSSGELEAFEYEDGKANKEKPCGVIILQDFIRMLDGFAELGESHCVGFKSLKDIVYFKTSSKVDFENWWKDFATFVPSPMKRSNTVSIPSIHNTNAVTPGGKSWLAKTYSSPGNLVLGKNSRSSSIASSNSDAETAQVEFLRNQLQKLEEENKKIPKLNEEKRKLELEVNYWKEYVTNTNALKRAGGKIDFEQESTKAKNQIVELQDELNETQKKLKYTSGKLLLHTKELNEAKSNIQEANHMISIHKATINSLKGEINMMRQGSNDGTENKPTGESSVSASKQELESKSPGRIASRDPVSECSDSHELEAKFVSLREKMKKIEKELFQKSKELEKANESRSKVAKYTRSLLQELETKLNTTQKKLSDTEDKLTNTSKELEMERERRIRLESEKDDNSRSRGSSFSSFTLSSNDLSSVMSSPIPSPGDKSENDVNSKYADYYRSRYKETESALFDKDKKLAETQGRLEELQTKYKSATNQFKSLDELQVKLSDATHKLSDRQLKIHELTREIESLRSFATGYERKSKELAIQKEKVSGLEQQIADLKLKVSRFESESEIFRIKETVMKEQITALEEECESSDESDDDETRLERQIDIKKKVDRTVELQTMVRQLSEENKKLKEQPIKETLAAIAEKPVGVGKSTSLNDLSQLQHDGSTAKVSELQRKNTQLEQEKEKLESLLQESQKDRTNLEDKLLREISELKGKQAKDLDDLRIASRHDLAHFNKLKEEHSQLMKDKDERKAKEESSELAIRQLNELVEKLKQELKDNSVAVSDQQKALQERDRMIQDRDSLLREKDQSFDDLTTRLNKSAEHTRTLEQRVVQANEQVTRVTQKCLDSEKTVATLQKENQVLRQQVERNKKNDFIEEVVVKTESTLSVSPDEIDGTTQHSGNDVELLSLSNEVKELREREEKMRVHAEETGKELIRSEEMVVQLSGELQGYFEHEKQLTSWVEQVEGKLSQMQAQLVESKGTMEAKAEDLERERNNVIHLVEVTSAYIKELEASLTEARSKIEQLQNAEKETEKTQEKRMPPEGSSERERDDAPDISVDISTDAADDGESDVSKLTAKISTLESEANAMKAAHHDEIQQLVEAHATEIERLKQGSVEDHHPNEEVEDLYNKVKELQQQRVEQEKKHSEEVKQLSDGYRQELKAAFSGETGNMDLLNRVQDLEVELEETRSQYEEDMKHSEEKHKKEIEEMKDDLGKVLQASMSSSYQPYEGTVGQSSAQEIEERIIELETEMQELKVKHEGELQMEREAHQKEMEETIRDMLMVREAFNSGRYEGVQEEGGSASGGGRKQPGFVTVEEFEDLKKEYETKLHEKEEEHDKELDQVRQDMATVIEAMRQGGPSETILELSTHAQELEKELEETRVNFDLQKKDLLIRLEKSESANFFGLRRNEEMGTKIYQMQREMEDMEWKHKLELQAYKDAASNGNDAQSINELMRVNEELDSKIHAVESELENCSKKHIEEMEAYALKLQEEKRASINEMTDKVLRLESLIEETKERHDADISEFELRSREERIETTKKLKDKIKGLEMEVDECKKECEEELTCLAEEHDKEIAELRTRYEKEIEELKKTESSRSVSVSSNDDDVYSENKRLKRELRINQETHQKELEGLNDKFRKDIALKQKDFDGQVADIRSEYEEKLKSCIKENMRRQSISDRKTDSQKIRELNRKIEELETEIERRKRGFQTEITNYKTMIEKQQALITELRSSSPLFSTSSSDKRKDNVTLPGSGEKIVDKDVSKQRIQELEEQIERYEKRIEYYRDKAQRDKEEENQRVGELQAEVHGLRSAMRELTEQNPESYWGPKQPAPESRTVLRRRSDNDERSHRARDNWKRWSDLHERQEVIVSRISELDEKKNPKVLTQMKKDEVGKSGSVARRKALWESIKYDEPARRVQRPLSSIRP